MTEMTLTMARARDQLRPLGLSITRPIGRDIRVNFTRGVEATAYYTNDLQDAVNTGRDMAERRAANK